METAKDEPKTVQGRACWLTVQQFTLAATAAAISSPLGALPCWDAALCLPQEKGTSHRKS